MYSFHFEKRINQARMGYIRLDSSKSGLALPQILGATLVNFRHKEMNLFVAQEMGSTDPTMFSLEQLAASGMPELATLDDLAHQASETWRDALKDATAIDRVDTMEAEERTAIEETTPSGLVIAKTMDHNPETEFKSLIATPDELDTIRKIAAGIMSMKPTDAPGQYL